MSPKCKKCHKTFSTKYSLDRHTKNAKDRCFNTVVKERYAAEVPRGIGGRGNVERAMRCNAGRYISFLADNVQEQHRLVTASSASGAIGPSLVEFAPLACGLDTKPVDAFGISPYHMPPTNRHRLIAFSDFCKYMKPVKSCLYVTFKAPGRSGEVNSWSEHRKIQRNRKMQ